MMKQVAEQLAEIQQQQKASAQTFAFLAHQHEGARGPFRASFYLNMSIIAERLAGGSGFHP